MHLHQQSYKLRLTRAEYCSSQTIYTTTEPFPSISAVTQQVLTLSLTVVIILMCESVKLELKHAVCVFLKLSESTISSELDLQATEKVRIVNVFLFRLLWMQHL